MMPACTGPTDESVQILPLRGQENERRGPRRFFGPRAERLHHVPRAEIEPWPQVPKPVGLKSINVADGALEMDRRRMTAPTEGKRSHRHWATDPRRYLRPSRRTAPCNDASGSAHRLSRSERRRARTSARHGNVQAASFIHDRARPRRAERRPRLSAGSWSIRLVSPIPTASGDVLETRRPAAAADRSSRHEHSREMRMHTAQARLAGRRARAPRLPKAT